MFQLWSRIFGWIECLLNKVFLHVLKMYNYDDKNTVIHIWPFFTWTACAKIYNQPKTEESIAKPQNETTKRLSKMVHYKLKSKLRLNKKTELIKLNTLSHQLNESLDFSILVLYELSISSCRDISYTLEPFYNFFDMIMHRFKNLEDKSSNERLTLQDFSKGSRNEDLKNLIDFSSKLPSISACG